VHLRIGILTVSDRVSAGRMEDTGGAAVERALQHPDWSVERHAAVPDEVVQIAETLRSWADDYHLDAVFTTGGTGLGPRDVTPEATASIAPRPVPGIAEAMRAAGMLQTQNAMLSRSLAAVRGTTLIVNLPGSPRGAEEGVEVVRPILEHAVAILQGGRH
jgi:molybdenum cofactor synthesis domain-containing protein